MATLYATARSTLPYVQWSIVQAPEVHTHHVHAVCDVMCYCDLVMYYSRSRDGLDVVTTLSDITNALSALHYIALVLSYASTTITIHTPCTT